MSKLNEKLLFEAVCGELDIPTNSVTAAKLWAKARATPAQANEVKPPQAAPSEPTMNCAACGKGFRRFNRDKTFYCPHCGAENHATPAPAQQSPADAREGWKEAAIAWEVCASLHRQYAKGKDALFTTRQADYIKHAENARASATTSTEGR